MLNIYRRAKAEAGYDATRFLSMVVEHGGLERQAAWSYWLSRWVGPRPIRAPEPGPLAGYADAAARWRRAGRGRLRGARTGCRALLVRCVRLARPQRGRRPKRRGGAGVRRDRRRRRDTPAADRLGGDLAPRAGHLVEERDRARVRAARGRARSRRGRRSGRESGRATRCCRRRRTGAGRRPCTSAATWRAP